MRACERKRTRASTHTSTSTRTRARTRTVRPPLSAHAHAHAPTSASALSGEFSLLPRSSRCCRVLHFPLTVPTLLTGSIDARSHAPPILTSCCLSQLRTASGVVFEGRWSANQRHGHGKQTFANGEVYEGQWHCNERGAYVSPSAMRPEMRTSDAFSLPFAT
eukprot:1467140-Pleurochrysis_carterae.AAC.1